MKPKAPRRFRLRLPHWSITVTFGRKYGWDHYPAKPMVGLRAGVIPFGFGIVTYMQLGGR